MIQIMSRKTNESTEELKVNLLQQFGELVGRQTVLFDSSCNCQFLSFYYLPLLQQLSFILF